MPRAIAIAMLLSLCLAPLADAADIAAGEAVFNRCKICHAVAAGKPSPVGPNLHGVFGRKAGTGPDFAYSAAMKNSGIVWNDDTLTKYLHDPRQFLPGNRMAFPGIADEKQIADLLAYLHQATR